MTSRFQPPPLRTILAAPVGDRFRRCQTEFVLGRSRSGCPASRPRCREGMMVLDGPRSLGIPLIEAQSKRHPKGVGTASLRLFTINRIGVHLRWNARHAFHVGSRVGAKRRHTPLFAAPYGVAWGIAAGGPVGYRPWVGAPQRTRRNPALRRTLPPATLPCWSGFSDIAAAYRPKAHP